MDKLRKYLRIALPAIFIFYLGCITAFTHVHIVDGVTIVHSHPYQKNADGSPKETHTLAEFQLLHQISTLQFDGVSFTTSFIENLRGDFLRLYFPAICFICLFTTRGTLSLRAPPVLSINCNILNP